MKCSLTGGTAEAIYVPTVRASHNVNLQNGQTRGQIRHIMLSLTQGDSQKGIRSVGLSCELLVVSSKCVVKQRITACQRRCTCSIS